MQIHLSRRSVIHLVALALAAVVWLGASPAFAQSTTVTPAGHGFTATANATSPATKVSFAAAGVTVTANSTQSDTVPAAPNNHNANGAVCSSIAAPSFTGGSSSIGGTVTITSSGTWTLCLANNNGSPTATLTIPQNGVVIKDTVLGITCTATSAPNGPATITGAWNNGPPPTLKFTSASVPVKTTGGFPCPSATTGTISATYVVSDTTDPTQSIAVGP